MAKYYKQAVTKHKGEDSHGFFIANSYYMQEMWATPQDMPNGQRQVTELDKVISGTRSATRNIHGFLQSIINSQNSLIKIWIDYWVSKGFNPPGGPPTGDVIKSYYDAIVGLQGMKGTLRMSADPKQEEYQALLKSIDQAQKYYNPYTYIKNAIVKLIQEQRFFDKGTFTLKEDAINQVLAMVEQEISEAIMAKAVQLMPKLQNKKAYKQQKEKIKAQYHTLMSAELTAKLFEAKDSKYRLNSAKSLIKSNKKEKSIHLLFNPKGQASSTKILNNEVISAIMGSLMGTGSHVGRENTRLVGSIVGQYNQPFQSLKNTGTYRAGKDDAKWDVLLQDNTHIIIHISNKLYNRRDRNGGKAVEGFRNVELEQSGTLDTRLNLIEELIGQLGSSTYEKLIFGIVNLHDQSLIHQDKKIYEHMLAKLFAAFMFNAQYDQVLDTLPDTKAHHIYLFNINGQYYTLAQLAQQILNKYEQAERKGSDPEKMIKVSITPASESVMFDEAGGGMILNSGNRYATANNPFGNEDWYEIRNRIIKATKISAVRADVLSILN